jgi:hypothetical protein
VSISEACACIHALMFSYICVHVCSADGKMIVRWGGRLEGERGAGQRDGEALLESVYKLSVHSHALLTPILGLGFG